MQIQNNNFSTRQNFKAKKVASMSYCIKNSLNTIDLYSIQSKKDVQFLDEFQKNLDVKQLFPTMENAMQERYKKVVEYCINGITDANQPTIIAVLNNKLCGILTYFNTSKHLHVDGLCSIPTEPDKKVPFVGKTFFCYIFNQAKDEHQKEIYLEAVVNGPTDTVKKYEELGFKKGDMAGEYQSMTCNKYTICRQQRYLNKSLNYEKCEEEANVDLEELLK